MPDNKYAGRYNGRYSAVDRRRSRIKVLMHYSGGDPRCSCPGCGCTEYEFLTVDHVNGGGRRHRKEVGDVYRWLMRNGYPKGYRVFCMNCNHARGCYGYCPHVDGTAGFDWPKTIKERMFDIVLAAAWRLIKSGVYPSIPAVMRETGKGSGVVARHRAAAIEAGTWPGGAAAAENNKRYRPDLH